MAYPLEIARSLYRDQGRIFSILLSFTSPDTAIVYEPGFPGRESGVSMILLSPASTGRLLREPEATGWILPSVLPKPGNVPFPRPNTPLSGGSERFRCY